METCLHLYLNCQRRLSTLLPLLLSQAGEAEARAAPRMRRERAEALMLLLLMLFYCYSPETPLHPKWAEIPLYLGEVMAHLCYQGIQT